MRNIFLRTFFILLSSCSILHTTAQVADSSLNETFDVLCAVSTSSLTPTSHWITYNPLQSTEPQGEWECTPLGNHGTPGMKCTGYFNNTANIDTSLLITPLLDLRGFSSPHIYLRFDIRTSSFNPRAKLSVLESHYSDSLFIHPMYDTDMSAIMIPAISVTDSTEWVTHEVDITTLKNKSPLYLSFRYVSDVNTATTWYLDNVILTSASLGVQNVASEMLPVTIIGNSTREQITFSFTASAERKYNVVMYDMVGRMVYSETINAQQGVARYTLTDMHLVPGIYCLKVEGNNKYGIAKVLIP